MQSLVLMNELECLMESPTQKYLKPRDLVVAVIDLQYAFTDPDNWLAKNFFNNQISADEAFITRCWDYAQKLSRDGSTSVFAIKLVHDIDKMKIVDPERYNSQLRQGLIFDDGQPKICAPGSRDVEFNFGLSDFRPPPDRIFTKCTRDITKEENIKFEILQEKKEYILLMGIDSNVCIHESALGLLELKKLGYTYQVVIPIDAVSTRPDEFRDTKEKFSELKEKGVRFIKLSDTVAE